MQTTLDFQGCGLSLSVCRRGQAERPFKTQFARLAALRPGAKHEIKLWGVGSNFSKAFGMPNAYLVADGVRARTIAATRPVIDPETGLEILPFVAPMTDETKLATKSDADKTRWLTAERAFDVQAGRSAPDARLAVLHRNGTVVGFLPHQRRGGAAMLQRNRRPGRRL